MFQKGDYTLEIKFQGDMTKKIVGVYRASYFDKLANETRYVVSTKFQPTDARRAFPCFDEPGFKSTFSLRVVRPRNLTCISNMPIHSEELNTPEPGYTTVFFEKSVPMVTYLAPQYVVVSSTHKYHIPLAKQAPNVEYAASIAPKMVEFYEDYFQVKYPLPKLDIIGIPEFISGAMEH
ncbi:Glutamyl aminopeptidase, partial [Orchesella cincta]